MNTLELIPSRTVLLVVDVQERLAAVMPEAGQATIENIDLLLEAAQLLGVVTVVTEQYPKGLGGTVPKLKERIAALGSSATTLEKLEFDATKNPGIHAHLETLKSAGKTHVILTGMEAHICVYQTARGLVARGFHVQVAGDATASRTKSNATLARKLWSASGATISGTETVLFDLLGKAGGDAFKAISKRLR